MFLVLQVQQVIEEQVEGEEKDLILSLIYQSWKPIVDQFSLN